MDATTKTPIDEDPAFSEKVWRVRRLARTCLVLFVAAAGIGLLGQGPFSRRVVAATSDSLRIEYDRFEHVNSPLRLCVRVPAKLTDGKRLRLWVDRGYLARMRVQQVSPSPSSESTSEDRLVYGFDLEPGTRECQVVFDLTAREAGTHRGSLGVVDGPELEFDQTVYP